MQATVKRGALLELLGKVKVAVPSRSPLPIAELILVRATKNRLELAATNLDVWLVGSCKAQVAKDGEVCLPPKLLESFLKSTKTDSVVLSNGTKGKAIAKIEAGSASALFDAGVAKDFPPRPEEDEKVGTIARLGKSLQEVAYAMAPDDSRPVLSGVCFRQARRGHLDFVAADGFRLAKTDARFKGNMAEPLIVPAPAVNVLVKLMPGDTVMKRGRASLSFASDGLELHCRAVQGTYPNYERLIPKKGAALTVRTADLKAAVKTVSSTVGKDKSLIRLRSNSKGLVVSSKSDEGETKSVIQARGKVKIAFNPKYLGDLLARSGEEMVLRTTSSSTPGVVRNNGTTHVIMPMFVQW